jgi:hypothetical protein
MTACPGRKEAISSCGGAGQNPSVQLKDPLSRRAEHLTAASASAPAFALVSLAVENPSQQRVSPTRRHSYVASLLIRSRGSSATSACPRFTLPCLFRPVRVVSG